MKYYPRDPDRAFAGMAELTFEQIGFYNLVLDLLYARDGIVPNDDQALAHMLRRDPRAVRRLKAELMAAGKLHPATDGLLTANGVNSVRSLANLRSISARSSANLRWEKYRKTKEINGTAMLHSNPSKSKSNNTEIPSSLEDSGADAVDDGDNFGQPRPTATIATGELAAVIRAKGWT